MMNMKYLLNKNVYRLVAITHYGSCYRAYVVYCIASVASDYVIEEIGALDSGYTCPFKYNEVTNEWNGKLAKLNGCPDIPRNFGHLGYIKLERIDDLLSGAYGDVVEVNDELVEIIKSYSIQRAFSEEELQYSECIQ